MKLIKKQIRGIYTDIWSAPRDFGGATNLFEWYFMADGWQSLSLEGTQHQDPVLMIMYNDNYVREEKIFSKFQT